MDSAKSPGRNHSPRRVEVDRGGLQGSRSLKKGLEGDREESIVKKKGSVDLRKDEGEVRAIVNDFTEKENVEGEQVIKADPKVTKGASWIEVAKEKKILKKYKVEMLSKDGKHTVEIPDEVLENSTPLWDDFVIGKFLDTAPHVAKVHMVLNKIWKYGDAETKVDVYEVNPTMMRFKVSSQKAREKILRRGMWNIAGVPMVVTKWTPRAEDEKQEEEAIPMWVHLEKVPLHMYSWEGLSLFTSTVGHPVKLHPETIACSNLEVAKVFVEVDVSKVLPKEITFSRDGKEFTVKYYYPWLPARCKLCDKWGHGEAVCGKKGKERKRNEGIRPPVDQSDTPKRMAQSQKEETGKYAAEITEVRLEETSMKEMEEATQKEDDKEAKEVEVDNEVLVSKSSEGKGDQEDWSLISPGKKGRASISPVCNNEILISASKFSVLCENEREEGELLNDDQLLDDTELVEDELSEDNNVVQQVREEVKAWRRGRKPKAQGVNLMKSSRISRRKQ